MTALVEVGTWAAFVGVRAVPEGRAGAGRTLARAPLSGVVTRCRQGFTDAELWRSAVHTSADLLWRVHRDTELAVRGVLSDGSYLTTRAGAGGRVHAGRQPAGSSIPVPSPLRKRAQAWSIWCALRFLKGASSRGQSWT